jgi:hypothetical protein
MKECSAKGIAQSIMGLKIFSAFNHFPRQLFDSYEMGKAEGEENGW